MSCRYNQIRFDSGVAQRAKLLHRKEAIRYLEVLRSEDHRLSEHEFCKQENKLLRAIYKIDTNLIQCWETRIRALDKALADCAGFHAATSSTLPHHRCPWNTHEH